MSQAPGGITETELNAYMDKAKRSLEELKTIDLSSITTFYDELHSIISTLNNNVQTNTGKSVSKNLSESSEEIKSDLTKIEQHFSTIKSFQIPKWELNQGEKAFTITSS